jgi:hypothetical protein
MNPTVEQLNKLTDAGIISDNAVNWDDVAPVDQERARQWLEANDLQPVQLGLLETPKTPTKYV